VQSAGLDGVLDILAGGVAHRRPGAEALAQAQERDVAVAVVGRLGQDGEDQLVEAVAVRRRDRAPVDEPQPVAQRQDATPRRALPLRAGDGDAASGSGHGRAR
jgi:hypothetical protein